MDFFKYILNKRQKQGLEMIDQIFGRQLYPMASDQTDLITNKTVNSTNVCLGLLINIHVIQ